MGNFRNLVAWRRAHELVLNVYVATARFPDAERFGLTSQIRRAAVSVASNLAEGAGRYSDRELLRYCRIANGSLQEIICQLLIARGLGYLPPHAVDALTAEAADVAKVVFGLAQRLRRNLGAKGLQ